MAALGETLTASPGTIADENGIENAVFVYRWVRVDGQSEADIDGAGDPAYTVAAEDIGTRLKVRAEFSDDDGNSEARTSAATAVILDTVAPELRAGGAKVDGDTLRLQYDEALNANSRPAASAFAVTVGGQPAATPTGVAIDGDTVTLTLSAAVAGGDAVTVSYTRPAANPVEDLAGNDAGDLTGVTVANRTSAPPEMPENVVVSSRLNDALVFAWSRPQDDGSAATDGYDHRFALGSSVPSDTPWVTVGTEGFTTFLDLRSGTEYAFEVRARNIYGPGPAAALTATTTGSTDYPATGAPTISGTVAVRSTLTASTAGIDDDNGVSGATYGFQWFQVKGGSATAINGETTGSYKVRLADIGRTLKVRVSFTDDGGFSESVTSAETAVVPHADNAPPTSRDASLVLSEDGPTYTFKPSDFPFSDEDTGHELEGIRVETPPSAGEMYFNSGRVSSAKDVPIENIEHHSLTYRPDPNHHGTPYGVFTFRVFDGTHHSADTYTFTIDVTAQPDDPTGVPSISGTAVVGKTLTADISGIGDVDGLQGAEFAYQWLHLDDDGAGGATETEITGATDATYRLSGGDLGKRIKVKVSFTDDGGSMHSLPSDAFPQTGSVKAANTPPTAAGGTVTIDEDTAHTFNAAEFNFSDADPGDALASVTIVSLPAAGSLTLAPAGGGGAGVAVTGNQSVAVADIGRLAFTPAANGNGTGYASFTFKVNDGTDDSAASYTMTVNVTAMNDPPTSAGGTVTIDEDTAHAFDAAEFYFDDVDAGDTLVSVTIVSLPAAGSLTLAPAGGGGAGVAVTGNQSVALADIGRLAFTPAADGYGPGYASFTFKVNDGKDDSALPYTMTVNVTGVNDPPTAYDRTHAMAESEVLVFTAFRFRYNDIDGDPLASVTILTVPEAGSLTLDTGNTGDPPVAVSTNQVIGGTDLAAGRLKFTPERNASGSPYASFDFRVNDGTVDSLASYTVTINVTAVNERPTSADAGVTTLEDTTYSFAVADFSFSDPDGDDLQGINIVSVEGSRGTIRKQPAGAISPPVWVSVADIAAGNLIFVPEANKHGSGVKSFNFTVSDGALTSTEHTVTIDVEPVNDWPTSSDNTVTTREDSHHVFTLADFNFGDADDGDQLESVKILSLPAAGSLAVDAADSADPPVAVTANQAVTRAQLDAGALKFTPEENAYGVPYATFAFKVNDGEADSPRSRTMTIDVVQVNDPPTAANNRLSANEDEAYRFSLADFSYQDLEGQPLHSVRVLALPERGELGLSGVQLTQDQRALSANIGRGEFRFIAAADANGAEYASFTFKVSDGRDDSAETYTMTFDVAARDDPPQGQPVIDGQAVVGGTVTADTSGITDVDGLVGVAFAYQWIRVGRDGQGNRTETEIGTATMPSYSLTEDDGGSSLKVKVTFTDNGGTTASLTSLEVEVGLGNQAPEGRDGYAGIDEDTSHVFSTSEFDFFDYDFDDVLSSVRIVTLPGKGRLMLDAENSADPPRAVVAQQSVSAEDIEAGKLRFEPAAHGNGSPYTSFTFKVSDGRAEAEQANTFQIDVFPLNDPATGDPVITGTARVGEALGVDTSAIDDADGLRNVDFAYQWILVDGNQETPISSASRSTYSPVELDIGKKLKVSVSFDDDEYGREVRLSAPTGVVPDNTAPRVASIAHWGPRSSPTRANRLTWRVSFSEDVANVDEADFAVAGTSATLTVDSATPSVYDVTAAGGDLADLDGTVTLTFANGQDIADNDGNGLTNTTPTGTNESDYGVDNTAPTAPSYTAPASLKVGGAISAISPSGGSDIDEYSATGLPSGLSIDDTSGVIGGTPDTADANTASAEVTVSDAVGNRATVSITFPAVDKGDQALSGFQYGAPSVPFGSAAPSVTAPSGVLTSLSYSAAPAGVCTVDPSSGALTLVGAGICEITATAASSANYNSAIATFTVTVQAAGALVLTLDAIAGDNAINIAEKVAGFTIGGDTGSVGGASITMTVATTELTATSADADLATWSVSVPADASYIAGTSVDVEVNASKTGYTSPDAVTRSLTVDLIAPTAPSYTAPASLKVGVAIGAMNPGGGVGIDEYGATGLPSGLSLDANTGVIGGTPDTADASTATATVTVSDTADNTATTSISFPAVVKGDQVLTGFQYSASTVTFGSPTVPAVTAPSGERTSLSYSTTSANVCSVDPSIGALTVVGAGICEITATAAATANYNEATASYTVTVQPTAALSLNLGAIAGDNRINIAEKAAGFAISGDTGTESGVDVTVRVGSGTLTGTSADDAGTATWSVSVPVDASYIAGTSVDVEVNASKTGYTSPDAVTRSLTVDLTAPTAPSYTVPASLKVGLAITSMSPVGGGGIDEYSATGLPSGLSLDANTGVVSGTPDAAEGNSTSATVTVSDTAGNSATVDISFPAVVKGDQVLSGFQYSASSVPFGSAAPSVTPPTGALTTLGYSATPAGVCTVERSTGALTLLNAGICEITATAAATANYNEATASYTVTVQPTASLSLNLGAIAGDNRINIAEKAAGFAISGNTGTESGVDVTVRVGSGTLTGTSADDAGTATWSVSVPVDASYIAGTSVDVEVNASKTGYTSPDAVTRSLTVDLTAPTAPSYSAPVSLKVGEAIGAMNPGGVVGIAEYGATGLPSGLALNTNTGVIGGTPDTADASTATATVTVSDAAGNSATVDVGFPAVVKGDQVLSGFEYSASSVTYGSNTVPSVIAPSGVRTSLSYSATPASVCTVVPSTGALTPVNAGICAITATAAATVNYNAASVSYTVTVRPAGVLLPSLDAIASDNAINIAEKAAGFSIGGDTGSVGGVSVTVTVGSTDLTATSADDAGTATWSVSVPASASYITAPSVEVEVNASKTGFSAPSAITRTLTVDLTAPTAPSYNAPGSLKVGGAITSMSPSGGSGIDEYSATGLPPGLSIDGNTGLISGTPNTANSNTASASVTVSDAAGNTASLSISFPAVAKGDQTLNGFQYSASSVPFGSAAPSVTPPTGALTTLGYSATPAGVCTVERSTGALTLLNAGICEITATAAATANYNEATASYTVTVQPTAALSLNLGAIAGDNRINIAEKGAGFEIDGDTGTESGVEVTVRVGSETLTATSADDAGTATWSVSVPANASYVTGPSLVVEVNASKTGFSAPVAVRRSLTVDLTAPTAPGYTAPTSLKVGVAINAMDPSGGVDIAEYGATGLPSGLTLNTSSGVINGTPDAADSNTASAEVTVSDAAGNTATATIAFPTVDKGDQALSGFEYSASSVTFGSAAPTVTAPTGVLTTLGYSATPATVCTVDPSSGALTVVGTGICEITATAAGSDDYNSGSASYTITVETLGTLVLNLNPIAGDNAINIVEQAAGFTIGGDTGTESGVEVSVEIGSETLTATSAADAGTARWSVSVPEDASYITGTSVDVEVNASKTGYASPDAVARSLTVDLIAPTAPSYTGPASLKVGEAIAAINPGGGVGIDEYGATGLPSGLTLNTNTGAIGGTPDAADASTASATVTVSDAAGNTATATIAFPAVDKGDQVLSGFEYSASSVTFGSTAPTVTAPTGVLTTLGYTATPASVCAVDPSSGALTLLNAGICEITATAAGSVDYNAASASYTVTVQAAGALVLNLNAIAGDNAINIAEKAAGFSIGGDTGTESGVDVTVEIGGETLAASSADDAGTATWSVSVPPDASYITGTSLIVEVNASKTGYSTPVAVRRSLTVDLTAPTAPSYTAPASLKVGEAIAAINPGGGAGIDEYGATGLPSGLTLNTNTGVIGGTPDTADASTASATVTVSDAAGNSASVDIAFPAVGKGDQALSGFEYSASSVTFGSTAPTVTAPTGVLTTITYAATPAGVCTVDPSSGALTLLNAGICEITATAAGSVDYNAASASYTVTVQAAGALVLNLNAIAGDNTINIAEKAAGFSIGGNTGTEVGVDVTVGIGGETLAATSADDAGTATWTVSVPADATYIAGTSLNVTVNASKTGYSTPVAVRRSLTVDLTAPTAPSYTAPASLKVGEAIAAINPGGGVDIDEYSATGLPSGLDIDTNTGVIGGTPDTADAGTATATVTVSDTAGNSASVDIAFPAVDKGDQTLIGFQYSASSVTFGSAAPTVTAPTGAQATLGYSATPAGVCTVDPSSGALTLVGAGTCEITATAEASDDYAAASASFTVTVETLGTLVLNLGVIAGDNAINIAEKAAGFEISGDTGTEIDVDVTVVIGGETLTATSTDDAGTAAWSVGVPAVAAYITGTSLEVSVSASKTDFTAPAAITRTLAVDLTAPTAPTYTAPVSLKVGEAITAINPSGDTDIDEYGATDLPSGLEIDTGSGVIGGTPGTANASTAGATVTVSDAAGNTATATIAFPAVDKGDQVLSGFEYSASSVTLGSAAPTVTAPTGVLTTLGYTATPASVCAVDPSSGALTLLNAGICEITATAAGSVDYNAASATFTVTVQTAGALVLNLDAIAGDNAINIAEKAAGFSIGGDTGTESGVDVTVEIGGETLAARSADDAGTATWSVSVPPDASYITGTSLIVEVNASKTGYSTLVAVLRSLTVDLTAPTAPSYTAPASLKVGEAIAAINPGGGAGIDEYGATGLPSGLTLNTNTGVIGGTPDTADANTASATVTVSDAAGNSASVDIAFPAVGKGDQALSGFEYSASSVTFGSTAPTVTAPTGVLTTLGYTATPAGVCTVDPSSGALTLLNAGICEITATAAGSVDYNAASATYTVTVQAAGALVLNLNAIAGDNTINIAEKVAGFSIGGNTGTEVGVDVTVGIGGETLAATSADDAGTATWTVSVPADATYIAGTSLNVTVNASKTGYSTPVAVRRSLTVDLTAPTAPSYTAPASLKVGEAIAAINPGGGVDIDEYSATGLPSGLDIDTNTGVIGGTPDTADAGTATATVTVSDTAGNSASVDIAFPAVDKGDQVLSGFQYSASSVTFGSTAPTVTAPTGVLTTLGYSATPAGVCTVDPSSGALTLVGAGTCEITAAAEASDDYAAASASFTVTVETLGTLVLNLNPIAGDNAINIAEKAAGFEISGDTGTEIDVDVTVGIGGETLTATSTDDAGTATWSVGVPAVAAYITGTSLEVSVSASTAPTYTAPTGVLTTLGYTATPAGVCTVDPSSGALTLLNAGICEITATAAGSDHYNAASASYTVTVQAAGVLALNLGTIAGDNAINIAEKAAGFSIGGDTGSVGAVSVTVTVGTAELTATSADADPTTWSVSVPPDASYITGTSLIVEVNASKSGYSAPVAVRRSLTVDLAAPTAPSYSAPSSMKVGGVLSAMNPSGGSGIGQYSATGLPSGLGIDGGSGVIGGTPDTADAGTASATVTVSDAAGNTATVSIAFPAVDKGDQALSGFQYSASSVPFGSAAPSVTAPSGVLTTLSYSATPARVCTVDPSTGALSLVNAGICEITATAVSSANYNEASATYTVAVREVETTLTLTVNPAVLDEHGGGTSVTVTGTLDGVTRDAPTTFTLSVGASDDAATEGTDYAAVGDLILTIPSGEASGTATFTLTAIDDFMDEPDEAVSIAATSRVAGFEVIGATVTIADNDERGVQISPASLTVPEGGEATYTVVLTSQPTGEVTVTPSLGSGDTDVTVSAALIFDATTWDQAQAVTVSAAQDADAANDTATIQHAVSGADYETNEVTADDVSVAVDDDETSLALTVDPAALDEHGGAASVTVTGTLDGVTRDEPTTLTVKVGAADDAAVKGTDYTAVNDLILTIPSGEASGTATFTLTAIDDFIDERVEAVSITGTIEDDGFEVIGTTVSIADNDERGVQISPASLTVPEGGDETYTLVLTSKPSGEVTVTPSLGSGDTDVTVSAALIFDATTWDQAQAVTVSAAQDADAANGTATIRHAVSGADYETNEVTADDVSVTVDDDETSLALTVDPAALDEHGGAASVTVTGTLDGVTRDEPTTLTVRVGAADDAAVKGTDYTAVNDLILTIPSGEASGTATFTLTAIDDFIDERVEAVSITGTIEDDGFEVIGTTVSIADNDERGVQISPASLTVPEGGDETYTAVLTSQPTGEVTVTPSLGSGDTDVTVSAALIFDATTWDQAQTVTVSAAQDADAASDTATIRHAVSGADYGAGSVTADDVSVTVDDADTAVTLTANPAALDEHGGGARVTVTATLGGVTRDSPTTRRPRAPTTPR